MLDIVELIVVALFFLFLGWSLPKISWSPFPYKYDWLNDDRKNKPAMVIRFEYRKKKYAPVELHKYLHRYTNNHSVNAVDITDKNLEMLERMFKMDLEAGDVFYLRNGEAMTLTMPEFAAYYKREVPA